MQPVEDPVAEEVRRLRADRSWSLAADPELLDRLHAGARRRHRRRVVATAACAVLLVTGGVAGVAATQQRPARDAPNVIADPAPDGSGPELGRGTAPTVSPSLQPSSPAATPVGGPVPAGMTAVSVTAIAPTTLWVLGDAPCTARVCTSVARSLDGGRSFAGLPAPQDPIGSPGTGLGAVSDLRFGSSRDGFAYGGSLWSTHDGAGSWSRVDLGHPVEDVAVAGGEAWAAVAAADGWELWRSPAAEDAWEPVELSEPLSGAPDLQVASGRAYVLAGDRLLVSSGGSLEARAAPCAPELGGSLSPAADGALWVTCPTGTAAGVWLARSASAPFRPVPVAEQLPNSLTLGAVSAEAAVLAMPGAQRLQLVRPDGSLRAVNGPGVEEGGMHVRFLGFTDAQVGYAVLERPRPALWRTEDGGLTWRDVPLA